MPITAMAVPVNGKRSVELPPELVIKLPPLARLSLPVLQLHCVGPVTIEESFCSIRVTVGVVVIVTVADAVPLGPVHCSE